MPQNGAARLDALENRLHTILGGNLESRARKLGVWKDLHATQEARLRALQTLVLGHSEETGEAALRAMEKKVAHWDATLRAQRQLDEMVQQELEENRRQLYDDISRNLLSRLTGVESAQSLEKFAALQKNEDIRLSDEDKIRPGIQQELVGQDRAFNALLSCLCSPYPQHILLTGPAGVGKTSAARLALAAAAASAVSPFSKNAPFIEVDGATLRFDPREGTDPLLGSVHDPIYQGARAQFAQNAMPEPKTGLVTAAHGGVLFIDEIGEMDAGNLNKLLKVLEDKRVRFHSSYYDPSAPDIPRYIRMLFEKGAPADFVLIGATTKSPYQLPAALLSRCAVIRFDALTQASLAQIAQRTAARLGIAMENGVSDAIASYTQEGRSVIRLLLCAHSFSLRQGETMVSAKCVQAAASALGFERTVMKVVQRPGVVNVLGVVGQSGCMIKLEVALTEGRGGVSINEAAGAMARDAARHAFFAVNALTGGALNNKNAVFNCLGGGSVDGPSIGLAASLALYSALKGVSIPQTLAVTGEVALSGEVLPVGGIQEKLQAAARYGIESVFLPDQNPCDAQGWDLDLFPVSHLKRAFELLAL